MNPCQIISVEKKNRPAFFVCDLFDVLLKVSLKAFVDSKIMNLWLHIAINFGASLNSFGASALVEGR